MGLLSSKGARGRAPGAVAMVTYTSSDCQLNIRKCVASERPGPRLGAVSRLDVGTRPCRRPIRLNRGGLSKVLDECDEPADYLPTCDTGHLRTSSGRAPNGHGCCSTPGQPGP